MNQKMLASLLETVCTASGEDMPPNGISDAKTPRISQNSTRGRMGKCMIEGSSTNGAPLGWLFDAALRDLELRCADRGSDADAFKVKNPGSVA